MTERINGHAQKPSRTQKLVKCDHGDLCPGHASANDRPCCYGLDCTHVLGSAQKPSRAKRTERKLRKFVVLEFIALVDAFDEDDARKRLPSSRTFEVREHKA